MSEHDRGENRDNIGRVALFGLGGTIASLPSAFTATAV